MGNIKYQAKLRELAKRQIRDNNSKLENSYLSAEEKFRLGKVTQYLNSELAQTLERYENGKPKLNLTLLAETAIHVPTEEKYITLRRIFDCANNDAPDNEKYDIRIEVRRSQIGRKELCVEACGVLARGSGDIEEFGFSMRKYYLRRGWNIISLQEFCDAQEEKITPYIVKNINQWYEYMISRRKSQNSYKEKIHPIHSREITPKIIFGKVREWFGKNSTK